MIIVVTMNAAATVAAFFHAFFKIKFYLSHYLAGYTSIWCSSKWRAKSFNWWLCCGSPGTFPSKYQHIDFSTLLLTYPSNLWYVEFRTNAYTYLMFKAHGILFLKFWLKSNELTNDGWFSFFLPYIPFYIEVQIRI